MLWPRLPGLPSPLPAVRKTWQVAVLGSLCLRLSLPRCRLSAFSCHQLSMMTRPLLCIKLEKRCFSHHVVMYGPLQCLWPSRFRENLDHAQGRRTRQCRIKTRSGLRTVEKPQNGASRYECVVPTLRSWARDRSLGLPHRRRTLPVACAVIEIFLQVPVAPRYCVLKPMVTSKPTELHPPTFNDRMIVSGYPELTGRTILERRRCALGIAVSFFAFMFWKYLSLM